MLGIYCDQCDKFIMIEGANELQIRDLIACAHKIAALTRLDVAIESGSDLHVYVSFDLFGNEQTWDVMDFLETHDGHSLRQKKGGD